VSKSAELRIGQLKRIDEWACGTGGGSDGDAGKGKGVIKGSKGVNSIDI
jgi:hypothetical protein